MSDKGVLTITPLTGSAISYDARDYVKYSIEVKNGNEIYVNGEKVGTITVDVADPTLSVVNNELLVNGKSQNPKIMLPKAAAYVTYTFKTSFSEASIVKSIITVKPE